jgi:flagellar motor switch protein FliM
LECNFGDCSEQIQIGVPYYMIEPVVKRMQARRQKDTAVTPTVKRAEWHAAYEGVMVPIRAEWDALELTIREVANFRVGDVIEMRPEICAETRIVLNDTPKFTGTVGLDTDRVAVQITKKIASEDSSHAKPDGRKVS